MTYGLVVRNSTLKTQIDSREEMFGMVVKSSGTGSTITGIDPQKDLIAIRMLNVPNGQRRFVGASWNTARTTVTFRDGDSKDFGEIPLVNVEYVHLTQARSAGFDFGSAGDNYGLQVKTPSGALSFDSRAVLATIRPTIANMFPPLYFKAFGDRLGTNPDQITSDSSLYVSMNGSTVGSPGSTPTYPGFATGVAFMNNYVRPSGGNPNSGAFFESTQSLGDVTALPNFSSIFLIRDVS